MTFAPRLQMIFHSCYFPLFVLYTLFILVWLHCVCMLNWVRKQKKRTFKHVCATQDKSYCDDDRCVVSVAMNEREERRESWERKTMKVDDEHMGRLMMVCCHKIVLFMYEGLLPKKFAVLFTSWKMEITPRITVLKIVSLWRVEQCWNLFANLNAEWNNAEIYSEIKRYSWSCNCEFFLHCCV